MGTRRETAMTKRTTTRTVTFRNAFVLPGFNEPFPAGDHVVETDEESMEGLSFLAYQRVLTLLHVRRNNGPAMTISVDPADLDFALKQDRTCCPDPESPSNKDNP